MKEQTPQLDNPSRAMVPATGCCHPEHEGKRRVSTHSTVWYRDQDNGFPYEGPCCRKCFAAHILKHYPKGPLADHIRRYPREYQNTYYKRTGRHA